MTNMQKHIKSHYNRFTRLGCRAALMTRLDIIKRKRAFVDSKDFKKDTPTKISTSIFIPTTYFLCTMNM